MSQPNAADKTTKGATTPPQPSPVVMKSGKHVILTGILIALMLINSVALVLLHRQQQQDARWVQQFLAETEAAASHQRDELEALQNTVTDIAAQLTDQQALLLETDGWLDELAAENELLKKKLH